MTQLINTRQATVWGGELGQQWVAHDERYDALLEGFNDALFAAADIGQHDAVLDVGCGTGQTTLLATRIASYGYVTGIDISPAMLDRARVAAEREQIPNVTFVQGDAEVYPFAAEAFDAAISRGGVMFFADPVAAFGNILRAMRSGGRLALVTPRRSQPGSEMARIFAPLAPIPVASELDAEMDRAMYSLSDPDDIVTLLRAAGFQDIQIEPAAAPVCWGRDAADAADFALGMTRIQARLARLDAGTRQSIRTEVQQGFASYESPHGVVVPDTVLVARATRP